MDETSPDESGWVPSDLNLNLWTDETEKANLTIMKDSIHKTIYYLLTALIAGCVLIMFVIFPGINDNKPSMFGDMIYGKASKPFVTGFYYQQQ